MNAAKNGGSDLLQELSDLVDSAEASIERLKESDRMGEGFSFP